MKRPFLNVLLIVILLLFITLHSYQFFFNIQNPIQIKNAFIETPFVAPGGNMIISADAIRLRQCKTTSHIFIKNEEGLVVFRDIVPFAGNEMGRQKIISQIKIPNDIQPGSYVYESLAHSDCGILSYVSRYVHHQQDRLTFKVVAANKSGNGNEYGNTTKNKITIQ